MDRSTDDKLMTVAGILRGSGELKYIITEFPPEPVCFLVECSCGQVTDTGLVVKSKMSNIEFESSPGGREPGDDPVPGLLQLIGKAVLVAMVEDWTAESLERLRTTGQGLPVRELPDDSISAGSVLQLRLMQQLAEVAHPLDDLSGAVRDFFALAVSGTRVLEDETISCRVVWASRGAVADPVFVLR